MFCQLDGEGRNAACPTLDQDRLAGFQLQRILDRANGRQARERHGRRIDMRQRGGLLRDDGGLDRDLFGIGAFLADVAHREHFVADTEVRNPFPDRRNDAGEIPPQNIRKMRKLTGLAFPHLPIRAVDAGCNDIDHDLARLRRGIRHLAEFQDLGRTVALHEDGFHRCIPLIDLRARNGQLL